MKEKTLPTTEEKTMAANQIAQWLDMKGHPDNAARMIREVLDELVPGIEGAYAQRLVSGGFAVLPNDELPRFLVDMAGIDLFEGKHGRIMRKHLLQKMRVQSPRRLRVLYRTVKNTQETGGHKPDAETAFSFLTDSKKTRWRPGGLFAHRFVDAFEFPAVFGGMASEPVPDRVEEVYSRTPYYKLEKFQDNMKTQILEILMSKTGSKRAIVSLPTGAGKTKAVAEAVVEFWNDKPDNVRFVLWIAQTGELCEQAVSCFKQIWEERGPGGKSLNIFRTWKGRGIPYSEETGIIVAGISQLNSIARKSDTNESGDSDLEMLGESLGAVLIDEAHMSLAPEYRRVLREIGIQSRAGTYDGIPLIGLTATPERTAKGETKKLHAFYGKKMIYPNMNYAPQSDKDENPFGSSWSNLDKMREKLTKQGYLARANYHYEDPGKEFEMSLEETNSFENLHTFNSTLMRRIGTDFERNARTYDLLKSWAKDKNRQVLFFGANVHQALLMSRFLEDDGISSATITGETRYGVRKSYIRMFRENEIQVLCNYEVLTTGFDAPKVNTIIIARPTYSRIIYQQMIGRGLRGPNFNGTKECDIITMKDTIRTSARVPIELGYMKHKDDVGDEPSK